MSATYTNTLPFQGAVQCSACGSWGKRADIWYVDYDSPRCLDCYNGIGDLGTKATNLPGPASYYRRSSVRRKRYRAVLTPVPVDRRQGG